MERNSAVPALLWTVARRRGVCFNASFVPLLCDVCMKFYMGENWLSHNQLDKLSSEGADENRLLGPVD